MKRRKLLLGLGVAVMLPVGGRCADRERLMSYSANYVEAHRWTGALTARFLKGEKPAQMPV
jgi:hypothetical protein